MTSSTEDYALNDDFPSEIIGKIKSFHDSLEKVKQALEPLTQVNINSADVNLAPLDRARLNLASGYALNSLFWMYLNTEGVNPHEHGVKTELDRYKGYMLKIKEIDEKKFAPHLDKGAAGRFVKGALWTPKEKTSQPNDETTVSLSKRPSGSLDHSKPKKRKN